MTFRLSYLFVLLLLFVSDVDIYSNTSSIPILVYNYTTIKNSIRKYRSNVFYTFACCFLMFRFPQMAQRTQIFLEHEICRRPTDQREVISRISRIFVVSGATTVGQDFGCKLVIILILICHFHANVA